MSKKRLTPILFNTEMVHAILAGRKTTTRRVVKPQPDMALSFIIGGFGAGKWSYSPYDKENYEKHVSDMDYWTPPCHGDDILYVRETWRIQSASRFRGTVNIEFAAGGPMTTIKFPGGGTQATEMPEFDRFVSKWSKDGWNPSIFMPKEATRIFLKVKHVSVKKLQDMEEIEAEHEGYMGCGREHPVIVSDGYTEMCWNTNDCPFDYWYCNHTLPEGFGRDVWDQTLKKDDIQKYGWDANPWVWVIEFERCDKPNHE